jgi:hypothetical protein
LSERPERIWVLGGKASNADRSIPWQENIPNIANSDKLFIDLNTIPPSLSIPEYEIRDYLRYMMMAGKVIYVILSPTSVEDTGRLFNMLPVVPELVKVKPCDFDSINPLAVENVPDEITEYYKYVENCTFFINAIDVRYLWGCLNPETHWAPEKYSFSNWIKYLRQIDILKILNVSCQSIGLASQFELLNADKEILHKTGQIIFLPPPTRIISSEIVEVMVNSLRGMEFREEEPDWVLEIRLPKTGELDQQISKEKRTIEEATKKAQKLIQEKAEIEKYRKLLWTYDKPLENTVKDAFILLGFEEIHEGRSRELEDWVIDFKSNNEFVHGVMEVKGREKRTSLDDMNQCFKWVNQYRVQEKKKVKGIFLPNQFRRTERLDSKKRLMFEPNEIEFAQDFEICVLSTSELFKAVIHILKGNKLSRNDIEKRILEANPICRLV